MKKKVITGITLILLLVGTLTLAFNVQPLFTAKAEAPSTWTKETVDSTGNVGWHTSLAWIPVATRT